MIRALFLLLPVCLAACSLDVKDDGHGNGMVGQNPGTYEAFVKGTPEVPKKSIVRPSKGISIPQENLVESPEPPVPDLETEDAARAFINGLSTQKPQQALPFVLPLDLFIRIRDLHIPDPHRAKQAARRLGKQIRFRIKKRLGRLCKKGRFTDGTFESIVLGRCLWVERGADWNRYAFWRCKKNTLYYHAEGERRFLKIRELINWGKKWYIISL